MLVDEKILISKHLYSAGPAKWVSKWGGHGTLKNIIGHQGWPARKFFEF